MHISAALIFEIIPPLPCLDASPAISIIFLLMLDTFFTRIDCSFFDGGLVYKPSTFDKSTKQSALISLEILAAKISLSPNFISSVAVVSFSLIIGMHPSLNRLSKVAIAFAEDFLFWVSDGLSKICATCLLSFLNSFFQLVISSIWPLAAAA